MNRNTLSLVGVTAALAAVTGAAVLTGAGEPSAMPAAQAARLPVERSAVVCPPPSGSDFASTTYTSFTPKGEAAGEGGTATLLSAGAGEGAKPALTADRPGEPVGTTIERTDAPALIGTADGGMASGWTVQQTTVVDAGSDRGVLGLSCTVPDSEFWFPGVSTSTTRRDYVHLTNPDDTPAVADLELYDRDGALKTPAGDGLTVPARSTVPVLLPSLTGEEAENLTLHVAVRSGRLGAAVQAVATGGGGDWLPASADPGATLVLPGIPADATAVRLVAYATGDRDADLKVRLATSTGSITPAGNETLHVKSGMTTAVDFGDLMKDEAGSLVLTPTDAQNGAPVVAALQITRGKGGAEELAFLPATTPVIERATAADNRAKGSTISLAAPDDAATVKIISSAGTGGGKPVARTVTVKAGTTLAVEPPKPSSGKGAYAVTVEPQSGGPVYASRTLALPLDGVPMFTVQAMPDDRGTVAVPAADEDLSVLVG